jgi:hypothetical protein
MYPNNQVLSIFDEEFLWPGVGLDGKFTNGDFSDPAIKPSFIPAETLNLILDNLSDLITKLGGTPNSLEANQLANLFTPSALARRAIMSDEHGRAQIAAPPVGAAFHPDDIARLGDIDSASKDLSTALLADQVEGYGRDLMAVLLDHPFSDMTSQSLINEAIAEVMAKLRIRLNNNGELDGSGIPDCRGLFVGNYLDGLDLSGIAAAPGGTAPQPWNDTYKNNRLVLSGFNTFTHIDTTNSLLFTFRNGICTGRMNPTNSNAGGYSQTELCAWLDGSFATGLTSVLGSNAPVSSTYKLFFNGSTREHFWCKVWPPTEKEVTGDGVIGSTLDDGQNVQFPIYQRSVFYRVKSYNGSRCIWWLLSKANENNG